MRVRHLPDMCASRPEKPVNISVFVRLPKPRFQIKLSGSRPKHTNIQC